MIGRALLRKLTARIPAARLALPDSLVQPGARTADETAADETADSDTRETDAIGEIGDVAERYWEVHHDEAAQARTIAMAKRLPTLLASALRIAWQASRSETITLIACNLAAGAMTTSVLLSAQRALGHLLAGMPTTDRLRAALPALLALAVLSGVKELLLSAAGRAQDRLRPRVDRLAELYLFETTTRVDAAAFETPAWADAMLRARDQGTFRARMVVMDGSDVLTGLVGVAAAIITLGVLHPLLVPLAIIAPLPDGWVAVRVAKMEYAVYRSISRVRRRMWLLGDRMADREHAIELRANTLRPFLLREWSKVAEIGQREQLALANREALARLTGRALSGAATWAAYVLLGVLLITGVLALAVAGNSGPGEGLRTMAGKLNADIAPRRGSPGVNRHVRGPAFSKPSGSGTST